MQTTITTLCYMERDDKYLMLHRVKKQIDVNKGKWIGVGGKLEPGESPEECLIREVREETGFVLTGFRYRGLISFVYADKASEYIFTYTSKEFFMPTNMLNTDTENAETANTNIGLPKKILLDDIYTDLPVPECDEGIFAWVEKDSILKKLELWEGDRYMLDYLLKDRLEPFSLKLCYDKDDNLLEAWEMSAKPIRLK